MVNIIELDQLLANILHFEHILSNILPLEDKSATICICLGKSIASHVLNHVFFFRRYLEMCAVFLFIVPYLNLWIQTQQ